MERACPDRHAPIVPSGPSAPAAGHPTGWGARRAARRCRGGPRLGCWAVPTRPGLLDCIERYFAAAPLPDARIEPAGALDVPIGDAGLALPGAARARARAR